MILINVRMVIRPEKADEWAKIAAQYARDVTAEAGNHFFEWYRGSEDPNIWIAVEGFEDGAAGGAHMGTAHVQEFMSVAPDYVAEQPKVIYVDAGEHPGWVPMGEIQPR